MKRIYQLVILCLIVFLFSQVFAGKTRDKLAIGFNIKTPKLLGDTFTGAFGYGVSPLILKYKLKSFAYLESDFGYEQLQTQLSGAEMDAEIINLGVKLGYRFLANKKLNPLLGLGLGILNFQLSNGSGSLAGYGMISGGMEYFINDNLGFNISGDYRYSSSDNFDGGNLSNGKDGFLNIGFGITYYLGGRAKYLNSPEFVDDMPEDGLQIENVSTNGSNESDFVQTSNEMTSPATDVMSAQKISLLKSIKEKDEILKLLKVKLNSFDEYSKMLEKKVVKAGIHPSVQLNESVDSMFMKRFRNGLGYFASKQYEDAVFTFKRILYDYPDNILVGNCWYWLGESYYDMHDYDAAIEAFEQALEKTPESFKIEIVKIMLGLSRLKAGDDLQAKVEFEQIMQSNPNSAFKSLLEKYLSK